TQAINNSNAGTPVSFYNLTLSNSGTKTLAASGAGVFEIKSVGTLTLTSNITFATGASNLTLNSDTLGAATVAALPSGASITGTVNVQRYLTGNSSGSRGWRLLSSPVSLSSSSLIAPDLTYVHANAYTTGSTGTSGGFDATGNPTFYFYRENMAPNTSSFISGNFRGVNKINNSPASTFSFDGGDANASLPSGNGYLFFFRGDRATTTDPTITTTIARPTTITALGYLNQGNITVKPWFTGSSTLSYTAATPTSVRGFNLVGNPYASSIDWDQITKTSITNTIWVYNPTLKVYATYVAGTGGIGTNFNGPSGTANIIPSGQGFFVKSTSTAAALTFAESNKVNTQVTSSSLLLATAPVTAPTIEYFRIQVYQDSLHNEDALVFFNSKASSNFVQDEDAEYFRGESPVNISTQSADGVALAVNQLPHASGRQVIPLNVNISADGQYQLNLTEIKNVPQLYDIFLIDNYKKDSVDIRNNTSYNFNATVADPNSFGSGRFSLVIEPNQVNAYRLLDFAAIKVLNTVQLSWKTQNEDVTTNFAVERSTDGGVTYTTINTSTSTAAGIYSYIDPSPNLSGQNLYRLKQQDVTGSVSYSIIVSVSYLTSAGSNSNLIKVYPNPTSSTINLTIPLSNGSVAYNIIITNIDGNKVKSVSTSQTNWQGDVSTLVPGTYFIQITNSSNNKLVGRAKFIKL
ncbi:MAG: T9SS type A sorting domain-containing protein, partial [Mucilaginibacter sp.]